jgi:hypothetical protein
MSEDHGTGDPWDRLTRWLKAEQQEVLDRTIGGTLSPTEYAGACKEHSAYQRVLERMEDIRLRRDLIRKPTGRRLSIEE